MDLGNQVDNEHRRELDQLLARHRTVESAGEAGLSLVVDPGGMDSGALLRAFAARLARRDVPIFEARFHRAEPLGALLRIAQQTCAFLGVDLPAPLSESSPGPHAGGAPGEALRDAATGAARGHDGYWGQGSERGELFTHELASLLESLPENASPVVILHDLHKADAASLRVIERLALSGAPSARSPLNLGASRPDHGRSSREVGRGPHLLASLSAASNPPVDRSQHSDPALRRLVARPEVWTLDLPPLDAAALSLRLQSPDVVERILRATGGKMSALERLLSQPAPDPASQLGGALDGQAPLTASLAQLLAIAEHPPCVLSLVRAARHDLVLQAEQADGDKSPDDSTLGAQLHDELRRCDLFVFAERYSGSPLGEGASRGSQPGRPTHIEGSPGVKLVSDEVEGAVHTQISPARRRQLALAWARALTERGDRPALRAHYLLEAGQPMEAAGYVLEAAEQQPDSAPESLAELVDRCVAALTAETDAETDGHGLEGAASSQTLRRLGRVMVEQCRIAERHREAIRHAHALLCHPEARGFDVLLLGELQMEAGELEQARETLRGALAGELPDGYTRAVTVDTGERMELQALLAEVHCRLGEGSAARSLADEALKATMGADQPGTAIKARNTLGKLLLVDGDWGGARDAFEANQNEARRAGLPALWIQATTNLGMGWLRSDRRRAQACFTEAEREARTTGHARREAVAVEALAVVAHLDRRFKPARASYEHAMTLGRRLGAGAMTAGVASNLGELYCSLGEPARAQTLCDLASRVAGTEPGPVMRAENMLLRGRIGLAERETSQAQAALETALDLFSKHAPRRQVEALLELVQVHLQDGSLQDATGVMAGLPEVPEHLMGRYALLAARIALASGKDGLDHARRARRHALTQNDPETEQQALVETSRALRLLDQPNSARRSLAEAWRVELKLEQEVPEDLLAGFAERPARLALEQLGRQLGSPRPRPLEDTLGLDSGENTELARWRRRYPRIIGQHPHLQSVFRAIDHTAPSDVQVLIRGESGTGKELVAEALHKQSPRRKAPFVRVNCAALVETLLLSELFGHERGAFTGADARRRGRFEMAQGGTLFLDEIGDISPRTQAALLRVLQEGEFERVGSSKAIRSDVRIITATHRDLEQMVRDGSFRSDLYYRLRGVSIDLPALRERPDDIPELARHLLTRMADHKGDGITCSLEVEEEALALLKDHPWPGNVRELQNLLQSAALFCQDGVITARQLMRQMPQENATSTPCLSWTEEAAGAAPRRTERLLKDRDLSPGQAARSRLTILPPAAGDPNPRPTRPDLPCALTDGPSSHDAPVATDGQPRGESEALRGIPAPARLTSDQGLAEATPIDEDPLEGVYRSIRGGRRSLFEMKKHLERECIAKALEETSGNITQAATLLGMKRPRLSQLVKQYDLAAERPSSTEGAQA